MQNHGTARKRRLVLTCFLAVAATCFRGQEVVKACPGLEVHSVNVSPQMLKDTSRKTQQETIETQVSSTKTKKITIVAKGPVLGSMDSEKLNMGLTCLSNGLVLTATITRSADYHGDVLQNVLWFPRITVVVGPLEPETALQMVWKMRLTNGKEVERARTPPYPEKKYPITVTKTLHWRQN